MRFLHPTGFPWIVLVVLCFAGVSGMLTACGACRGPSIDPLSACTEVTPFGQPLGDNAVFVGPTAGNQLPEYPEAVTWDPAERQVVEVALTDAVNNKFGGPAGFGSLDAALTEFGVSTDNPIVLVRRPEEPGVPNATAAACKPYVYVYNPYFGRTPDAQASTCSHEMAHYWDDAHNRELNREMKDWINWGDTATAPATNDREDLAYAVQTYFWPQEDKNREWTDDMGAGLVLANDPAYGGRGLDGLRLAPNYRDFPVDDNRRLSATGTEQVYDRYDYLECRFTGSCLKPLP
jgi:hypothetical protein